MKHFNQEIWSSKSVRWLLQVSCCNNPTEAILKAVRQVFRQYGKTNPPFVAEEIATIRRVKRVDEVNMSSDGLLIPVANGFIILLNVQHHRLRGKQNFSCAHEIGHTFFFDLGVSPPERIYNRRSIEAYIDDEEERLCDIAAAELLMPSNIFERISSDYKPSIKSIRHIARQFEVSFEAAFRRVLTNSTWECIIVQWKPMSHRNPESELYIDRMYHSKNWHYHKPFSIKNISDLGVKHTYTTGEETVCKLENGFYFESVKMGCANDRYVFSLIYKGTD